MTKDPLNTQVVLLNFCLCGDAPGHGLVARVWGRKAPKAVGWSGRHPAIGFELVACGLLLGVLGWLLRQADPTSDLLLPEVAMGGGACCLATGVRACRQGAKMRLCAGLLLLLAAVLGWQAWMAWERHLTIEDGYRPVPVMATVLCITTLLLGRLLWQKRCDPE